MAHIDWNINKGDLVKISNSDDHPPESYGVVISKGPYTQQMSLFPVVSVFSFSTGQECEYYPYNLEIVSAAS